MTQPNDQNTARGKDRHSGHKETFDQIVLMLILAFSFRVFVVEAFVIPTGSMAPTLMGAHSRYVCDNCGYHYDVNFPPQRTSSTDISIPRMAGVEHKVFCPNCGYRAQDDQALNPRIYYGDRILVNKFIYLLQAPKRWDVIVFKTPSEPQTYHYSQAYIKRLVGKPGEQIMILDGDIYVATKPNPVNSDWQIQTKPDHVQNALWRIINDTDHAPLGLTPAGSLDPMTAQDYIPWKPSEDGGWKVSRDATGARALLFSNPNGEGSVRFDPSVGHAKRSLTDFVAYDQYPGQGFLSPVGDLKLSFFYTRSAGGGPLELSLSRNHDLFIARIEADHVKLFRATLGNPAQRTLLADVPHRFGNAPVRIDFMNLDFRVRLLADGKELFATTPAQYAPDVAQLKAQFTRPVLASVGISAQSQVCSITHLSLWRDIYYTNATADGSPVYRGTPNNPVKLGPGEYFALGDNSPLSGDGRLWRESVFLPAEDIDAQAGVVPERFLLGKAVMVYWPAGYRLYLDDAPDLIPNFGEMRFIH